MCNQKLAALLACVALVGGIAWAALESQTIALPSGAQGVDAILIPGAEGSDVSLAVDDWIDEVDLRVGFDPDGTIRVNGEIIGMTDVSHNHGVSLDIISTSNGYEVDVIVTDLDLGLPVGIASGVDFGNDAPAHARARGQAVTNLTSR